MTCQRVLLRPVPEQLLKVRRRAAGIAVPATFVAIIITSAEACVALVLLAARPASTPSGVRARHGVAAPVLTTRRQARLARSGCRGGAVRTGVADGGRLRRVLLHLRRPAPAGPLRALTHLAGGPSATRPATQGSQRHRRRRRQRCRRCSCRGGASTHIDVRAGCPTTSSSGSSCLWLLLVSGCLSASPAHGACSNEARACAGRRALRRVTYRERYQAGSGA